MAFTDTSALRKMLHPRLDVQWVFVALPSLVLDSVRFSQRMLAQFCLAGKMQMRTSKSNQIACVYMWKRHSL